MKKVAVIAASLVLISLAAPGYAAENQQKQDALKVVKVSESQPASKNLVDLWITKLALIAETRGKVNKTTKPAQPAHAAPEIDASSAGLALALMGGIIALRRERRGKQA